MAHSLSEADGHRLRIIKRGSENAPVGYVNIKRDDVLWLIQLVESPPAGEPITENLGPNKPAIEKLKT